MGMDREWRQQRPRRKSHHGEKKRYSIRIKPFAVPPRADHSAEGFLAQWMCILIPCIFGFLLLVLVLCSLCGWGWGGYGYWPCRGHGGGYTGQPMTTYGYGWGGFW